MPRMFKVIAMTAFPTLPYSEISDPDLRWEAYTNNPMPLWLKVDAWISGAIKLEQFTQSEFECYSKIRTTQFMIAGIS